MSLGHKPAYLQKVWAEHRNPPERNGYIQLIDWPEREVVVKFYDSPIERETETFSFDVLEGNWSDKFGGTWMLED